MVINDPERIKGLVIEGFDADSLNASSYDVRVGSKALRGGSAEEYTVTTEKPIEMEPGSYVAVMSAEKVRLGSKESAILGAKRNLSYAGIILLTGMQVHPGYEGHLVFGLFNASGKTFWLQFETKLCTITFLEVAERPGLKTNGADKDLASGKFPPGFIERFAEFKTQGWIGLEKSVGIVTTDLAALKTELQSLRAKVDDIHGPIKKLTEDVTRVSEAVRVTDETVKALAVQHGELMKDVAGLGRDHAERRGRNTVIISIVVALLSIAATSFWNNYLSPMLSKAAHVETGTRAK